ncbi:MAG TPA: hypothetical protein VFU47_08045 [Armatimonadota bacterium]|nr:hypothetical protein [Armatimonadota bacterium]
MTVCTFDSNTLNNYLISCCQNTGAGDNAGFANCMINNGGWFCGTCGS